MRRRPLDDRAEIAALQQPDEFEKQLEEINASLEAAVDRVMDAKPNAFILGISALSVWGGTPEWGEELKRRVPSGKN